MTNQKMNRLARFVRQSSEEVSWLIAGLVICCICFYLSSLMGGIGHPAGASMLAFPVVVFCLVLAPVIWEEFKKDFDGFIVTLEVWQIKLLCLKQRFVNRRANAQVRDLNREIFLGWLHS